MWTSAIWLRYDLIAHIYKFRKLCLVSLRLLCQFCKNGENHTAPTFWQAVVIFLLQMQMRLKAWHLPEGSVGWQYASQGVIYWSIFNICYTLRLSKVGSWINKEQKLTVHATTLVPERSGKLFYFGVNAPRPTFLILNFRANAFYRY